MLLTLDASNTKNIKMYGPAILCILDSQIVSNNWLNFIMLALLHTKYLVTIIGSGKVGDGGLGLGGGAPSVRQRGVKPKGDLTPLRIKTVKLFFAKRSIYSNRMIKYARAVE